MANTNKVGRPRLHPDRAAKQFAYRQRKKAAQPPKDVELAARLKTALVARRREDSFLTVTFWPEDGKDLLWQLVEELEYDQRKAENVFA